MSTSPSDFYHQKTDAELRFFVDNPGHYQPELVEAAARELRRRGVAPTPAAAPTAPYEPAAAEAAQPGGTGKWALVALALVLAAFGAWYFTRQPAPAPAAAVAKPRKAPKLETVATSALPSYEADVARSVDQQLARVPAAERAAAAKAGQPLSQYRELAKRFWTAETLTEYVTEQARTGKTTAVFPAQVELVQASWEQWNKARQYGYTLGPVMDNHLDLMSRVARQQQEALADVLLVAQNPQPFENEQTQRRAADMSDMLSGLLPVSPVTKKPYTAVVRRVRL